MFFILDARFQNIQDMLEHNQDVHPNIYECLLCNKITCHLDFAQHHLIDFHKVNEDVIDNFFVKL